MALKSGDQLLLLLFVSSVSLAIILCPGNVFARVISGRCETGHYRKQNKGWWTRSAINIPPLEFLNLHQYEKKSKWKSLWTVFKCVKNASWPFLQGEGACKRFLAIFCTWMSILENSNLHSYEASLQTFMCWGPRVSWVECPLCSADNWDNAAHHILLGAFLFWQSRWHQCSAQ